MDKHNKGVSNAIQHPKDKQIHQVYTYLQKHCATATMAATALNIHRPNLCRYKKTLQKAGQLAEVKKGYCEITKHSAKFLTTNPDLFPINPQLNLF